MRLSWKQSLLVPLLTGPSLPALLLFIFLYLVSFNYRDAFGISLLLFCAGYGYALTHLMVWSLVSISQKEVLRSTYIFYSLIMGAVLIPVFGLGSLGFLSGPISWSFSPLQWLTMFGLGSIYCTFVVLSIHLLERITWYSNRSPSGSLGRPFQAAP